MDVKQNIFRVRKHAEGFVSFGLHTSTHALNASGSPQVCETAAAHTVGQVEPQPEVRERQYDSNDWRRRWWGQQEAARQAAGSHSRQAASSRRRPLLQQQPLQRQPLQRQSLQRQPLQQQQPLQPQPLQPLQQQAVSAASQAGRQARSLAGSAGRQASSRCALLLISRSKSLSSAAMRATSTSPLSASSESTFHTPIVSSLPCTAENASHSSQHLFPRYVCPAPLLAN
jgi:hypothetical protein